MGDQLGRVQGFTAAHADDEISLYLDRLLLHRLQTRFVTVRAVVGDRHRLKAIVRVQHRG